MPQGLETQTSGNESGNQLFAGSSIERWVGGNRFEELCERLASVASEHAGVEVRHPTGVLPRIPMLALLVRYETHSPLLKDLKRDEVLDRLRSEVPTLSTDREVTFNKWTVIKRKQGERYVILRPSSRDRQFIGQESSAIHNTIQSMLPEHAPRLTWDERRSKSPDTTLAYIPGNVTVDASTLFGPIFKTGFSVVTEVDPALSYTNSKGYYLFSSGRTTQKDPRELNEPFSS